MTKHSSNQSKGHPVDDENRKTSEKTKVVKFPVMGYYNFPLNLVMFFPVLVLKLISIHFRLGKSFFSSFTRLTHYLIVFPFRIFMGTKKLIGTRFPIGMCFKLLSCTTSYIYTYMSLGFTRALFWLSCACFVLAGLIFSGFLMGGVVMKRIVEQPIHITESLNFDYTKSSPVALVPVNVYEHKVQLTVALTLPESEYNMKLGMFQVRVDLLSSNGKVTAGSSHPCMLKFKSSQILFTETIFRTAPLIFGFLTESQILKIKIRNLFNKSEPIGYLKVSIQQREEFNSGGGIPQIYDASLTIESELSKLKNILWFSRRAIFVCTSLFAFWIELVTILFFLALYITHPRVKTQKEGSGDKI